MVRWRRCRAGCRRRCRVRPDVLPTTPAFRIELLASGCAPLRPKAGLEWQSLRAASPPVRELARETRRTPHARSATPPPAPPSVAPCGKRTIRLRRARLLLRTTAAAEDQRP